MNALGNVLLATIVLLVAIAATTKHSRWLWLGAGIMGLAACVTEALP